MCWVPVTLDPVCLRHSIGYRCDDLPVTVYCTGISGTLWTFFAQPPTPVRGVVCMPHYWCPHRESNLKLQLVQWVWVPEKKKFISSSVFFQLNFFNSIFFCFLVDFFYVQLNSVFFEVDTRFEISTSSFSKWQMKFFWAHLFRLLVTSSVCIVSIVLNDTPSEISQAFISFDSFKICEKIYIKKLILNLNLRKQTNQTKMTKLSGCMRI